MAAGCGGKKTDVSEYFDNFNERISQQGGQARFDCPDEVDGHDGTEFECTIRGPEGGETAKVKMEIRKEGDDLVVYEKDAAAVERALQTVNAAAAGGQQGGAQGGGQQPPAGQGEQQQPPAQGGGEQPPAEGQGQGGGE